jgi:ABC-2 type transport system permease protein
MKKLLHITLHDLSITFQDKGIWVNLVVVPIVLISVIGFVMGGGSAQISQYRVDVVDQDQGMMSGEYLAALRTANSTLILCPMDHSPETDCRLSDAGSALSVESALQRVKDRDATAAIIIPEGFSAAILNGDPVMLQYRSDEAGMQPSPIFESMQLVAQRFGALAVSAQVGGLVLQAVDPAVDPAALTDFQSQVYQEASGLWASLSPAVVYESSDATVVTTGYNSFSQAVFGMGSMYVMFTVMAGTEILLRERTHWTLQRIMMMPVQPWQFIGGKMLSRFIMGMIQFVIAFAFGVFVLNVNLGSSPLGLLLVMMAFAACITAIALLLATIVEHEQQASMMTTFIVLSFAPLGGAWWPLEIVPDFMRIIGHISPIAWAMDGFTTLASRNGGVVDVLLPVAVLLGAAVIIGSIAVRRFRYD